MPDPVPTDATAVLVLLHDPPALTESCQRTVGVGLPDAPAVKVALAPLATLSLVG